MTVKGIVVMGVVAAGGLWCLRRFWLRKRSSEQQPEARQEEEVHAVEEAQRTCIWRPRISRPMQNVRNSPHPPMSLPNADVVSSKPRVLTGVKELLPLYKGVLLDQFGVLHDGEKPYPGAVDAVKLMYKAGMKIILLSNSSQRASSCYDRLENMGFLRDCIAGVVTSGELAYLHLRDRPNGFWSNLGKRVLHFTWSSRGKVSLDGLDLEVVTRPSEADFILAHGTEAMGRPGEDPVLMELEDMKQILDECAVVEDRNIPMIVANPDLVTVATTLLKVMPGTLGKHYESLGGHVEWMGKPAPIIYKSALEMAGLASAQMVAIGDSLEHDIKGATGANVDSWFVCGGIHADDLAVNGDEFEEAKLEELCHAHGTRPKFVSTYFKI